MDCGVFVRLVAVSVELFSIPILLIATRVRFRSWMTGSAAAQDALPLLTGSFFSITADFDFDVKGRGRGHGVLPASAAFVSGANAAIL